MNYFKLLLIALVLYCFSAVLFSYTQLDLSLTLTRSVFIKNIQSLFQQIGFFQRSVAALWFALLIISSFSVFFGVIIGIQKKLINFQLLVVLIAVQIALLFFSYPGAFSYDIFNYIFTAKSVVFYHQNPYEILPLWFQGIDPMLSFMRWTHLPSAYTPLWIILTLPFYLLSGNIFIFALPLFKLLQLISYSASCWLVWVSLREKKYSDTWVLMGTALFAFNPLIVLESLVSAHNDIVMMTFALGAYVLYIRGKKISSFLVWSFSVALKLMTFPLGILYLFPWKRWYAVVLLITALLLVLIRREFLPWYGVWIIPFAVLLPEKKLLQLIILALSLGLLLRYIPVFYTGGYEYPVRLIQDTFTIVFPLSVAIVYLVKRLKMSIMKR